MVTQEEITSAAISLYETTIDTHNGPSGPPHHTNNAHLSKYTRYCKRRWNRELLEAFRMPSLIIVDALPEDWQDKTPLPGPSPRAPSNLVHTAQYFLSMTLGFPN